MFSRSKPRSSNTRLLVVVFGGIGDAVMYIPFLNALRRHSPTHHISLVIAKQSPAELVFRLREELFDELIEVSIKPSSFQDAIMQNKRLIDGHFDRVLISYLSAQSIFFLLPGLLSANSHRIGLVRGQTLEGLISRFFNDIFYLDRLREQRSEIELHALLLDGMPIEVEDRDWKPVIPHSGEEAFNTWRRANVWSDKPYAVIHAGSFQQQDYKRYPLEKFLEVIQTLHTKGFEILLIGSKSEASGFTEIQKALPFVVRPCYDQALYTVMCILRDAALFVGNDSGLGHLSILLNRPTVRIFGPSFYYGYRKWKTGPFEDIIEPITCSPCLRLGILEKNGLNAHTCGHRNCLNLISPERVVRAIEKIIYIDNVTN